MNQITVDQPTTADQIREHLTTIIATWNHTADPMNAGHGTSDGAPLPSSTIVLRADITNLLAYWVHALVDEWPAVLQHLEPQHYPTTNPDAYPPTRLIVVTETLDCTDVYAMADLLRREADRIAVWGDYGATLATELEPLANAARLVSRPPRRDRVTLGHCTCGGHIAVRAVPWVRVPYPTTDPSVYPPWSEYQPEHEQPIRCPGCHVTRTIPEWFAELVGVERPLPADELVDRIHADLGMRYSPQTVRVWANRGVIKARGYSRDGRAVYDRVQVYAALIERTRLEAISRGA